MTQRFGWNEAKRRSNYRKHDVDFADVDVAFDDPGAIIEEDDSERYGEARFKSVAIVGAQLLSIVFTERDDIIRIISARPATKREKVNYASSQNYSS